MDWTSNNKKRLIQAILALETESEARRFLRDLMTEKEIVEFSKRLQAAEMLTQQVPYTEIVRQTGLSSTTVARVARWLRGRGRGYQAILAKLHHHNTTSWRSGLS